MHSLSISIPIKHLINPDYIAMAKKRIVKERGETPPTLYNKEHPGGHLGDPFTRAR